MPNENNELQTLQKRILDLEEELSRVKKGNSDGDMNGKISQIERERDDLKKELADVRAKIWDGKDRRQKKERRNVKIHHRVDDEPIDDDAIGGPFQ